MVTSYRTLSKDTGVVLYKEQKSKFYGQAFPLSNESEIKTHLERLATDYKQANHICYAWQLGIDTVSYRTNDDGEPNNSAGAPIYGQIRAVSLTNVLVVVAREFGGVKLGVGGLIQAYKGCAALTLESAKIVERQIIKVYQLQFPYALSGKVHALLGKFRLEILEQEQGMNCSMHIAVPLVKVDRVESSFSRLKDLGLKVI